MVTSCDSCVCSLKNRPSGSYTASVRHSVPSRRRHSSPPKGQSPARTDLKHQQPPHRPGEDLTALHPLDIQPLDPGLQLSPRLDRPRHRLRPSSMLRLCVIEPSGGLMISPHHRHTPTKSEEEAHLSSKHAWPSAAMLSCAAHRWPRAVYWSSARRWEADSTDAYHASETSRLETGKES